MIRKKLIGSLMILTAFFLSAESLMVRAGGINDHEAALIEAAGGTFTYEGVTYKAKEEYLTLLQAKLSEDDMDLSAEQVSSLMTQMYDSVAEGLEQGVLEPVGGETGSQGIDGSSVEESDEGNTPEEPTTVKTEPKNDVDSGVSKSVSDENSEEGTSEKETFEKETSETEMETEKKQKQTEISKEQKETETTERESETAALQVETKEKNELPKELPVMAAGMLVVVILILAAALGHKKKKKKLEIGKLAGRLEFLTDVHCHILPAVDDGAQSMESSLQMIDLAYREGVRRIIATPHYHMGHRHKKAEELKETFSLLQEEVRKQYPDLEIKLGNEVFYSDGILERLEQGRALSLDDSKYVLVEFHIGDGKNRILEGVTRLSRAGYIPVIAHVERYQNLMKEEKSLESLKEAGALLQMNFSSIPKNKKLIKKGYIDLLGTDCHNSDNRAPVIRKYLSALMKCVDAETAERILLKNPDDLWNHRYH